MARSAQEVSMDMYRALFFLSLRKSVWERLGSVKNDLSSYRKALEEELGLGRALSREEEVVLSEEILGMVARACEEFVNEQRRRLQSHNPDLVKPGAGTAPAEEPTTFRG